MNKLFNPRLKSDIFYERRLQRAESRELWDVGAAQHCYVG